jgi:hypothetical protein
VSVASAIDWSIGAAADAANAVAEVSSRVVHGAHDLVSRIPEQQQGIAALVAAASITVTLVTLYLWPRDVEQPMRETMDAAAIRRLARQGASIADIARRTGMSHDAVATIIRAASLTRSNPIVSDRKTRPAPARSAGWLKLAGLRKRLRPNNVAEGMRVA